MRTSIHTARWGVKGSSCDRRRRLTIRSWPYGSVASGCSDHEGAPAGGVQGVRCRVPGAAQRPRKVIAYGAKAPRLGASSRGSHDQEVNRAERGSWPSHRGQLTHERVIIENQNMTGRVTCIRSPAHRLPAPPGLRPVGRRRLLRPRSNPRYIDVLGTRSGDLPSDAPTRKSMQALVSYVSKHALGKEGCVRRAFRGNALRRHRDVGGPKPLRQR